MSNRDRLVAQFRELVTERLARINRSLMSLEGGADVDAGQSALRELHGLKGEARMMGFAEINHLVHEMEELVRSGQARGFALAPGSVDALLVCSDAVGILSGAVAGQPPDVAQLVNWLAQATTAERTLSAQVPVQSTPVPTTTVASPSVGSSNVGTETGAVTTVARAVEPRAAADTSIRITQQSLEVLTSSTSNLHQRTRQREAVELRRRQLQRELAALHRMAEDFGPAGADLASRLGRAKDLLSDINRRNTLLNTEEMKDLTVLSEEITALRMVPLSVLFEPWPRLIRDLARDLKKEVDVTVEGEDERVDRSVLEALRDPLLHLVRNAVDHGIESPQVRAAAGKPPRGKILLQARREGERLVIRVRDDGRGLDPRGLREVAVRRGLIDRATADRLSDLASIDLIFISGFSSKDAVTDVSGRGVGLDVVRTQLVSVGGEVTVDSSPEHGSSFELRVPISLTVAPVLFVQVGDERLCLTASNVERAITVETSQLREVAGKPAIAIDDQVLPFSSVASILYAAPERPPSEGELVLVLRGRGQSAAVAVDRVLEERVQAILPLKGLLSRYAHLSGATPLSDGELALVMSAPHLVATVHGRELRLASGFEKKREVKRRKVLVVDDSPLTRELLVSLLESVGYHVVQAVDGGQAFELLNREAVDIVVTDLEMPRVDGLELTRRLKSHATLRTLPVVIVTTRGSEADRRRGMDAGADGYVTKGDLVRQDLVDVVARLLA
ncbi:MAG: response regulator [Archangium sp.]|nr:response regulator [Archangium sp.]